MRHWRFPAFIALYLLLDWSIWLEHHAVEPRSGARLGAVAALWLASGAGLVHCAGWRLETLGYLALAAGVLYLVFGSIATSGFKEFYFLFLPVIWAASRQGLRGTALMERGGDGHK